MDWVSLSIHAVSVVASAHYGAIATLQPQSAVRTVQKTLAVGLLAVLAWRLGGSGFLVAGLALSALGDGLLAGRGQKRFLLGVVSFAAAHACYIPLFLQAGAGSAPVEPWRWLVVAALVLAASGVLFGLLWARLGKMRGPLAAYFAIIVVMGALASLVPASQPMALVVAVGATLFVASDGVLGWELFGRDQDLPQSPVLSRTVWVLYYGGQTLICFGGLGLV